MQPALRYVPPAHLAPLATSCLFASRAPRPVVRSRLPPANNTLLQAVTKSLLYTAFCLLCAHTHCTKLSFRSSLLTRAPPAPPAPPAQAALEDLRSAHVQLQAEATAAGARYRAAADGAASLQLELSTSRERNDALQGQVRGKGAGAGSTEPG